jgi:hypothetical protein
LTDSGGACICTDATDSTCATDLDYNLCLVASFAETLSQAQLQFQP